MIIIINIEGNIIQFTGLYSFIRSNNFKMYQNFFSNTFRFFCNFNQLKRADIIYF